jgi:hypothetical protein
MLTSHPPTGDTSKTYKPRLFFVGPSNRQSHLLTLNIGTVSFQLVALVILTAKPSNKVTAFCSEKTPEYEHIRTDLCYEAASKSDMLMLQAS